MQCQKPRHMERRPGYHARVRHPHPVQRTEHGVAEQVCGERDYDKREHRAEHGDCTAVALPADNPYDGRGNEPQQDAPGDNHRLKDEQHLPHEREILPVHKVRVEAVRNRGEHGTAGVRQPVRRPVLSERRFGKPEPE